MPNAEILAGAQHWGAATAYCSTWAVISSQFALDAFCTAFGLATSVAKANHGTYWRRQVLSTHKGFARLRTPLYASVRLCTALYTFVCLSTP